MSKRDRPDAIDALFALLGASIGIVILWILTLLVEQ